MINDIMYMLKTIYKNAKTFFLVAVGFHIIRGFSLAFANVVFLKLLFDAIQKNKNPSIVLAYIVGYAVYQFLVSLFYSWFWKYFQPVQNEKLRAKLQLALYEKCRSLELQKYDSPGYYNDYIWAIQSIDKATDSTLKSFCEIVNQTASLLTIILTIFVIDWKILILFFCAFVVSNKLEQKVIEHSIEKDKHQKPLERENMYTNRVFYLKSYACELRTSYVSTVLIARFKATLERLKESNDTYGKKIFAVKELKEVCSSFLNDLLLVAYLIFRLFYKGISMGDFTAVVNSIWRFKENLDTIYRETRELAHQSLYIKKYKDFVDDKSTYPQGDLPFPACVNMVELKNVAFNYDLKSPKVLSNINLTITSGEKIAIVGPNGAGKTTLVKLILGLYAASEGTISINNIAIEAFRKDDYYKNVTCQFQNFNLYAASLAENISMDRCFPEEEDAVKKALVLAGLEDKFKYNECGINIELTKEYDPNGLQMSGGEGQKIAIARALYQRSPIVILDEPTSALDVTSEYEFNSLLSRELNNESKIVILVTHRLSSTRMVDRIIYLEDGEIIEQGSHDELMRRNGKYAEMYNVQAEKYKMQG